jgi:Cdc6-like AAA superfamily ATPase
MVKQMRDIKIHEWDVGEEKNNTIKVLTKLLMSVDPKNLPRGIDKFRTYNRIAQSFDKAEETGIIVLEEADYIFLREQINNIPALWGLDKDASISIETFLDAEEYKMSVEGKK